MLMDVVEDEKIIALVVDYQPSVCVGVGGQPGRAVVLALKSPPRIMLGVLVIACMFGE